MNRHGSTPCAELIERQVSDDREQPSAQLGFGPRRSLSTKAQETLLHDVARLIRITEQLGRILAEASLVSIDQRSSSRHPWQLRMRGNGDGTDFLGHPERIVKQSSSQQLGSCSHGTHSGVIAPPPTSRRAPPAALRGAS